MSKMTVIDAFNTLYQKMFDVRANAREITSTDEYQQARTLVNSTCRKLNEGVLEFLAVLASVKPNAKISFIKTDKGSIGLYCTYDNVQRALAFNGNGQIVYDEISQQPENEK